MSAWLATWVLRAVLAAALLAAAYGAGRRDEASAAHARQALQDAASAREYAGWVITRTERSHALARALSTDRERISVVYRTITQEVERATANPGWTDCDIPDDGLRLLRAASEGPGEPAAP